MKVQIYTHTVKRVILFCGSPASIEQQFGAVQKGKRTDEFYLHYFKDGKAKTLDQMYDLVNKGKTRQEGRTGKDNLRETLKRLVSRGFLKEKPLPNPLGGKRIGYYKSMTPESI
jgi:hypothetical protein